VRGKTIAVTFALGSAVFLAAALQGQKPLAPGKTAPRAARSHANFDETLPVLGTQLSETPAGAGKEIAASACLTCHSADILRQQRLDEKKWAASVTKMVGWGAEVPDAKKDELIAYLVKNFGPDNASFQPVVTRPVGR
jgi:quinoprotein glucose dehydrogenase